MRRCKKKKASFVTKINHILRPHGQLHSQENDGFTVREGLRHSDSFIVSQVCSLPLHLSMLFFITSGYSSDADSPFFMEDPQREHKENNTTCIYLRKKEVKCAVLCKTFRHQNNQFKFPCLCVSLHARLE